MPQSLVKNYMHITFSTKNIYPFIDEHHKKRSFKDEYLTFLKEYNINYDERYVWD